MREDEHGPPHLAPKRALRLLLFPPSSRASPTDICVNCNQGESLGTQLQHQSGEKREGHQGPEPVNKHKAFEWMTLLSMI